MQAFHYGAHELIELHEVLNNTIDAINTFQLYQPYVYDQELQQIMTAQLLFSIDEYNNLVHIVHGLGVSAAVPYRAHSHGNRPVGVMMQPVQQAVNANQLDERDIASAMLSLHKSGARCKLNAALETANLQIRNLLLQSVSNCANQAYEVWDYLFRRGYYPMVTLPVAESAELLSGYRPVSPQEFAPSAVNPVVSQEYAHSSVSPEVSQEYAHSSVSPVASQDHSASTNSFKEPSPANLSQFEQASSPTASATNVQNEFASEAVHAEPIRTDQPARKKNSRSTRSQ